MLMISRIFRRLLFAGMAIAGALIVAMMVIVSADVLLRNFGWGNLPWAMEVAEYILFIATFLAAPWAMHRGLHVQVDVVTRLLPRRAAAVSEALAGLIGLVVSLFLLYYGIRAAWDSYSHDSLIFKQLVIPEWWLLAFIPFTGLLLSVESVLQLSGYRAPRNGLGGDPLARDGI